MDFDILHCALLACVLALIALHVRSRRSDRTRQERLLAAVPYPMFIKDLQGRYLYVNPAYEAAYCVRASELAGRSLIETRHLAGVDCAALHAQELTVIESGTPLNMEVHEALPEPGQSRHTQLWLHRMDPSAYHSGGLVGSIADMTSFRNAESLAQTSGQRLIDITATLPAAVFQIRRTPDGQRSFTYVAGDTLGTIGLTPKQIMDDEPLAFSRVHPDDQLAVVDHISTAVAAMRPVPQFDIRMLTVNGERWIRTAGGQPRRTADGAVEWSGYWVDVTELHEQALELIEAKAKAESASAAKVTFLAMMSHEIRTPVAGVLSSIELLELTKLDVEQRALLGIMQDSAGMLLQLLGNILDYSRIESGRITLESAPLDLRALIDSVYGLHSASAADKQLALYSIVDWRIAGSFLGDATRLRQVMSNLLSNAIKFTAHGHVVVRAELLEDRGRDQLLSLSVSDTGIGIPPEQRQLLFEPFEQGDESIHRKYGGTGLGLAICRQLAAQMGGRVHLTSQPGIGTRVIFEVRMPTAGTSTPPFAGKHALLCLRDLMLEQHLSSLLAALGFVTRQTTSDNLAECGIEADTLLVLDSGQAAPPNLRTHRYRISVTPHPHRLRIESDGGTARSAPLLWSSLAEVCMAVYRLRPQRSQLVTPMRGRRRSDIRVLVAEDDSMNRTVVSRQLRRIGIEHDCVADGEQALEALSRDCYGMLLTDCHMPVLDGFELTRRIRASESDSGQHLPVIALTAGAMPEDIQRCLDAGVNGVLTKPVGMQKLETIILQLAQASPDSPSLADQDADTANSSAGLLLLLEALGDREQVARLLDSLIDDLRRMTVELEHAELSGDGIGAEKLRHQAAGALALVQAGGPGPGPTSAADLRHRIDELVRERRKLLP